MRSALWMLLSIATLWSCQSNKSDLELFDEGKIRVQLSADTQRGYDPLVVTFNAFLENDERAVNREIREVKWLVKGPHGFKREHIQDAFNYQDTEMNKDNFFFWEMVFRVPGRYKVRVIVNDGEFASNYTSVRVLERPGSRRQTP